MKSVGLIKIKLPLDEHSHIPLQIHVVDLDIPMIIGQDVIKWHSLLVNYINNQLEYRDMEHFPPMTYKGAHVFLVWDSHSIMFTRGELTRLHQHFMHPAPDSLSSKEADQNAQQNPSEIFLKRSVPRASHLKNSGPEPCVLKPAFIQSNQSLSIRSQ